jgi:hypothetical protein
MLGQVSGGYFRLDQVRPGYVWLCEDTAGFSE